MLFCGCMKLTSECIYNVYIWWKNKFNHWFCLFLWVHRHPYKQCTWPTGIHLIRIPCPWPCSSTAANQKHACTCNRSEQIDSMCLVQFAGCVYKFQWGITYDALSPEFWKLDADGVVPSVLLHGCPRYKNVSCVPRQVRNTCLVGVFATADDVDFEGWTHRYSGRRKYSRPFFSKKKKTLVLEVEPPGGRKS